MPVKLKRDSQQWIFDWVVKETGKVFHFQPDGRGDLPRSVRNHDMISKHVGKMAQGLQSLAQDELQAGHNETAMDFYFQASTTFASAQHPVFENNAEKQYLHSSSIDCYDKVRELAPYPIEHVDIPWENQLVSANLHLLPDRRKAPCVIFIPGCDMTKEMYPHPHMNHGLQRGVHVLSLDGPGQGECNLRGTRLTDDNYERAVSAVVDYLVDREEIDSERIAVYGLSFGSFWALRAAAHEKRLAACVAPWASYADKYYLMQEESPRYKQLFAYLTQSTTEEELDAVVSKMSMSNHMPQISCPTLLACGEYDPRSPLEEVYDLYDRMVGPRELWVYEDQHHMDALLTNPQGPMWNMDVYKLMFDWLADRFSAKPLAADGQVQYIQGGRVGPHGAKPVSDPNDRWWFRRNS